MSYLLDTNAAIALLNGNQAVRRRARYQSADDLMVSSIVIHELYFGAHKGTQTSSDLAVLDAANFAVIDFSAEDAIRSGEIRAALQARGKPIGPYDVLIAGQAVARGLTLVTANIGEFSRVDGLRVENWEA